MILNIPDNSTNGEVIKLLFPNIETTNTPAYNKVYTGIPFGELVGANIDTMKEWWDAPYELTLHNPCSE